MENPQSANRLASQAPTESKDNAGLIRVVISTESNQYIDDLAERVNEDFDAGKVSRSQILNWIVKRFAESAGDAEIQELRAAHFDRIAYLEAILKRAKATGVLPPELNAAIQAPSFQVTAVKKRKPLTKNITNDDLTKDRIVD